MKKLNHGKLLGYGLIVLTLFLIFGIPYLYSGDLAQDAPTILDKSSGVPLISDADSSPELIDKFKPHEPESPLIPRGVTLSDYFEKGVGNPVGQVQQVQGKVYVIHSGQKTAYKLQNDAPLFTQDTLITSPESRLNALMNDKSVLSLAPQAKLTITKSEYFADENKRSTVLNLIWGSARFIVEKISGKTDFIVKTKTAVCGARATDFAVSVVPVDDVKKASALDRILAYLNPVRTAHAFLGIESIMTVVLTGADSSVGLVGVVGQTSIVGSASVASVVGGSAAGGATFVGAGVASGVLNSVGPGLASLSIPPKFNLY